MSDIFISYARSAASQAQAVAAALRSLGYAVWLDDELPAHRTFAEVIEERLRAAKAVVVIWSDEAVKSQWVRAEADVGRGAGTLVQLSIDGVVPPLPFNQIQCADMNGWTGDTSSPGWRKVVASVEALIGARPSVARTPTSPGSTAAAAVRGSWFQRHKVLIVAAMVAIIAAAAIIALMLQRQPGVIEQAPAVVDASAVVNALTRTEKAIAVLPFANMSPDPQYEYFADGMTEEILNQLSAVHGLRVTSRTSSFSFKGKQVDVPTMARQLGVSYVVEGSVRNEGKRVRVTAQLIDVAGDAHLWSEVYERELDDVFAIQADVSRQIVKVLKIAMGADELHSIGKPPTADLEAWQQFLRASLLFRNRTTPSDLEDALALIDAAIARDPGFARAHALRATLQMTLGQYADPTRFEDYWRQALAAADRALELDSTLGQPYLVRALNAQRHNRWGDANHNFMEATARAPGNPDGRSLYGQFLMRTGYLERGWAEHQRAGELDPLSPIISWQAAYAALITGRLDFVRQFAQRSQENGWPAWQPDALMGGAAMHGGDIDLAERLYIKALPQRKAQIEQSMAALRNKHIDAGTRAMLDGLSDFGPPGFARWSVESYIGDVDAAIATLSARADPDSLLDANGGGGPVHAPPDRTTYESVIVGDVWFPTAASVRRDPRFVEFVRAIGLVDFWRENGWPDLCRPEGKGVKCE